jgi:hypothetical protein
MLSFPKQLVPFLFSYEDFYPFLVSLILFAFGRLRVQISARSPAILTHGFRGLAQSVQENAAIES